MWRVVCLGPGPMDRVRRVLDRGPLLPEKGQATAIANFLRSTGLYESVKVEASSAIKFASVAVPGGPAKKSIGELSSMTDEQVSPETGRPTDET